MAQFTDLPAGIRARMMNLFLAGNYCFATRSAGRTPSFYFTSGGPNVLQTGRPNGRLRTQHTDGPLIEISTRTTAHWFFYTVNEVFAAANDLAQTWNLNNVNQNNHNFSHDPEQGDYHFEFSWVPATGQVLSIHPSGGQVDLTPIHRTQQITDVIAAMLRNQCRVEVDGQVLTGVAGPTRNPAGLPQTVNGYLAAV